MPLAKIEFADCIGVDDKRRTGISNQSFPFAEGKQILCQTRVGWFLQKTSRVVIWT